MLAQEIYFSLRRVAAHLTPAGAGGPKEVSEDDDVPLRPGAYSKLSPSLRSGHLGWIRALSGDVLVDAEFGTRGDSPSEGDEYIPRPDGSRRTGTSPWRRRMMHSARRPLHEACGSEVSR